MAIGWLVAVVVDVVVGVVESLYCVFVVGPRC